MEKPILVINEKDNVAVALRDLEAGETMALPGGGRLTAATDIPYGHKVALVALDEGDPVVKYGEAIGLASRAVGRGEWVHTHNMGAPEDAMTG
jgi:altronate dehydratase